MKPNVIVICSLLLFGTGLGCTAISSYITPAQINEKAVEYAVNAGIAEQDDYKGYGNLEKAERLHKDVEITHSQIQFDLEQQAQKDNLKYGILKGITLVNLKTSQLLEERMFGPQGLLTLGLSLVGFGGFTGMIGLMRKRPGDVTPEELNKTLNDTTRLYAGQLSEKELQFTQLVQGIHQIFQKYQNMPTTIQSMKDIFDKTQDTETQLAVTKAKQTMGLNS